MTVTWFDGASLTVQIGFGSNPSTAIGSTTWTDVSAYVRGISTSRGRGSELEQFRAGTMTLVLDNRDRRFDPNYSSSPYSPNVLPMKRARVQATYSGTTYDVWSGFVDDWPQVYDPPNNATVTVQCTDGFKVLSLSPLAESVHWYDVMSFTPSAWWRLGESSGTVAVDSSGNGFDGNYAGGATANSRSGLLVGSSDAAIGFDGVDDYMIVGSPISAFPVSIEMWFQTTTGASSVYMNIPVAGYEVYFEARTDGKIRANLQSNGAGAGIVYFTGSATTVNDGNVHHVVATYANNSSSPTLYVDGVAESAISSSQSVADDDQLYATIGAKELSNIVAATIDEVAVYPSTLSAGNVSTLYSGGHNPWESDGTGARIGRYLDKAGWPSADRTVATGISTLQSVTLGGANALSLTQTVEFSEQGQFYIAGNGQAIFRDRHWRFENSSAVTSQGTFGDAGGGELLYSDIVTDGGEQFMVNHVRAQRSGGALIDVTDSTSITAYFERLDSSATGLDNQSDLEVRDIATWRLATRKNPIPRVTMLEVKPRAAPASLFPQVLGRDIGHRLTVKRRPQNVGTALTYTVLIEGVGHSIDPDGGWVTRFYLSSTDSNPAFQPLIFDDAVYGILDVNVFGL